MLEITALYPTGTRDFPYGYLFWKLKLLTPRFGMGSNVHTGSEAHPAFCSVATGSFAGSKAEEA